MINFANVLCPLDTDTTCFINFHFWFATLGNSVCPKTTPSLLSRMLHRAHPRRDVSRLDGWSLCGPGVLWVRSLSGSALALLQSGTMGISACLLPNAITSTSSTMNSATNCNIRVSREWAVGWCWALGEDVSGNSPQLLDGYEPEDKSDDFQRAIHPGTNKICPGRPNDHPTDQ